MAQKVQVLLVDDITGGEADETVIFGLDGATYEIDLAAERADKLRDLIAKYVEAGRKTGGRVSKRGAALRKAASKTGGADPKDVRAWAAANGLEVNDRGRVPASIYEAYEKAHG